MGDGEGGREGCEAGRLGLFDGWRVVGRGEGGGGSVYFALYPTTRSDQISGIEV